MIISSNKGIYKKYFVHKHYDIMYLKASTDVKISKKKNLKKIWGMRLWITK